MKNAKIQIYRIDIYVKRIFVITEIVRMNAGVSSKKEKVKE